MDNKPLNRIKVMLAERMMDDQQGPCRDVRQRPCHRVQMGDKHLSAQLRESD